MTRCPGPQRPISSDTTPALRTASRIPRRRTRDGPASSQGYARAGRVKNIPSSANVGCRQTLEIDLNPAAKTFFMLTLFPRPSAGTVPRMSSAALVPFLDLLRWVRSALFFHPELRTGASHSSQCGFYSAIRSPPGSVSAIRPGACAPMSGQTTSSSPNWRAMPCGFAGSCPRGIVMRDPQ